MPSPPRQDDENLTHCSDRDASVDELRLPAANLFPADITARQALVDALVRSEKLASLGRLASSIAHEINNPLATVMNLLFLAKNHPDCPPAVKEDLVKAESELMRVAEITRRTLSFYRDSADLGPVSLLAIMEETLRLFETRFMAKGVKVENWHSHDARVAGMAGDLRQVLACLISNSLDAMADDGTLKLRIREVSRCGTRAARITIADNGRGIASPMKPHVFEPLFTTKETLGTGLGLWVARQLVQKHGGAICFRSNTEGARRGTTFVIQVPIVSVGTTAPLLSAE